MDAPKAFHCFYGPETSDQAQRFQYSEVMTINKVIIVNGLIRMVISEWSDQGPVFQKPIN